jgi:hypothetical protein
MARVLVVPDRPGATCVAEVLTDDEGGAYAVTTCGRRLGDRGHFADTVEVAAEHVDRVDCRAVDS